MAGFCLDTGPLLDYLILRNCAEAPMRKLEEVSVTAIQLKCLEQPLERRAFLRMLHQGRPLTTVDGVLVEIGHHIETTHDRFNTPIFWRTVQVVYAELKLDPSAARLDLLEAKGLADYGVVDETLVQHCLRTGATLVSIDRRLKRRAGELGVRHMLPEELLLEFGD